jgi:phage protein D
VIAVSPPKEKNMTSTTEQTETPETKAAKKAVTGARRANVTSTKGKAGKKATPKKKAPKSARNYAREGSKTATIIDLLKRPGGATAKELLKATSWQPHSLRGFLSGTIGKKMGLTVASTKGEDGGRSYSIKA